MRKIMLRLLTLWALGLVASSANACPPPDGYVQCGGEGDVCELSGPHFVTFGVFGDWDPGRSLACTEPVVITGPVTCSEAALTALDPGSYKTCWVKDAPPPAAAPAASPASAASIGTVTLDPGALDIDLAGRMWGYGFIGVMTSYLLAYAAGRVLAAIHL